MGSIVSNIAHLMRDIGTTEWTYSNVDQKSLNVAVLSLLGITFFLEM
jgi:hypothetical protein